MHRTPRPLTVLRAIGVVLLVVQGSVHLRLWLDGFRAIPTIGPLFLAGAGGALGLAAVLAVSVRPTVVLAALLLSAGQVVALVATSTVGLFGFMTVWTWSGAQGAALWSELLATVVLAGIARWQGSARPAPPVGPNALQSAHSVR